MKRKKATLLPGATNAASLQDTRKGLILRSFTADLFIWDLAMHVINVNMQGAQREFTGISPSTAFFTL
jgi:hypothetical protein